MPFRLPFIQAALYETTEAGDFCAPEDPLAKLLLGPNASKADLEGKNVRDLYAIPAQRSAFLARLRAQNGKPCNDHVLLRLHDGLAWCRCRSVYRETAAGPRYSGLLVRLDADDDWVPGQVLGRIGYAYLLINSAGHIVYASKLGASRVGFTSTVDLVDRAFVESHWADQAAGDAFLARAWKADGVSQSRQLRETAVFRTASGTSFGVQIEARVRQRDVPEAALLEVFWRDLAEDDAQLHEKSTMKTQHPDVITTLVHDLRAPATSIRNHARYLRKQATEHVARTKASDIEADVELQLDLLDTIETVSRERPVVKEATRIYEQVIGPIRSGLGEKAKHLGYKGLEVHADDLRRLPPVMVDRSMMRQVFYDLITNAIKYGPDDGRTLVVELDGSIQNWVCEIIVRDWGMGIPQDKVQRVFDLHYRTDEAVRRDPTGSGIGLAAVRKILEWHGGTATVKRPGNPTEIELVFHTEQRTRWDRR